MVSVVGMRVPAAKNRVDDESAPGHLERRESKDFLVCGLDPLAGKGIVIVHDHGVQPKDDDFWGFQSQTPEEELEQKPPKSQRPLPGHARKKSFDRV